ncbi:50S ribosomal protein L35 [Thermoclostridium stercorarium subsp. thermolacticum DSM 2910]|jgi:large subunit ribosomal protein L35|uniref:Large ribosomal subunit protein bL35 n=2 Tax=Thermoclostridium stercorarium TaxID=1510 RepID=A0A1B1YJS3_THEST|nr:50S ribosomal protein L35 [Thermoclostridium stercorarium]AGI39126.1 ribosomal protein L35 [Thermoclostridium stercorarium subsp. stercorarium DSM 8532]ANW98483.1 50S ribosomal protein L35 [Thermoclostridium stercorarium subsp. thermolacticum DSM 2910]ANX01017.1 50S ribosomal protein L35 [Thermoclostridium stercorarium subsp. leptospartum DSM 9219]
MPKLKTHSSSKKRFRITSNGKVKRNKAYKSHILTKKSSKRKRNLRKATIASSANTATIKAMLPYK